jgi:hypothetical protein
MCDHFKERDMKVEKRARRRRRTSLDKTVFVQSLEAVPEGYVAMASLKLSGTERRSLSDAHRDGVVPAVKIVRHEGDLRTGPVFVDSAVMQAWLATYRETRAANAGSQTPVTFASPEKTSGMIEHGSAATEIQPIVSSLREDVLAMREELRAIGAEVARLVALLN